MAGNAALLIDFENFFLGREENVCREREAASGYDVQSDLDVLSLFARDLAGFRRLVVQRAYANFNAKRPNVHADVSSSRRFEYYLQHTPALLMEQGIEPIQVYNFPGGSNKNAADMRIAMDATALLAEPSGVDFFVLVTGDADFIRLGLELRRRGAEVAAIGIRGSTKRIFQRYFDDFEYFEDLLAAREVGHVGTRDLAEIRNVMHSILDRRRPIQFAAAKPLLTAGLGHAFDPSLYDCESTGEFLRENAEALGLDVRPGEHDWEIDKASNGSAPGEDLESHSVSLYRGLLRRGHPKLHVKPFEDWSRITDHVFSQSRGDGVTRPLVYHRELLDEVSQECARDGLEEAGKKVNDVLFHLFKSGCFLCAEDGDRKGSDDFHWTLPAQLDPELPDVDALRDRALRFLIGMLRTRLAAFGYSKGPRVELLAEMVHGPGPSESDIQATARVAEPEPEPEPESESEAEPEVMSA